jgi:hypothetical protein
MGRFFYGWRVDLQISTSWPLAVETASMIRLIINSVNRRFAEHGRSSTTLTDNDPFQNF